jgi:hypothetical protein
MIARGLAVAMAEIWRDERERDLPSISADPPEAHDLRVRAISFRHE